MIPGWLACPLEFRALLVGFAGVLLATQLNRAIYRWAWFARPIGPWSAPHPQVPHRTWHARLPIIGWWFLRQESEVHGSAFWVRPMLIEAGFGVTWSFLYMWLCGGGNLPPQVRVDTGIAHAQFLSQAGLLAWLVIATFIDIDEQTIPDAVTIPGALLGLLLAAVLPFSLLPTWPNGVIEPLLAASPAPFPLRYLQPQGLALACLMYLGWWFVIWPKTITFRHGYVKAGRYMLASMLRHPAIRWFLFLVLVGLAGIAATWWRGGLAWQALFSSLVGMIWGGAMVWGVRIVGTIALRREAMGFGDVTFLAMIGTYLGWQSTTFVFFIAPFTGVILALAQWLFTGKPAIPYGPFLAAASAVVLFAWPVLWSDYELVFHLGWGIPLIGFVCLLLMGGMLSVWRRFAY